MAFFVILAVGALFVGAVKGKSECSNGLPCVDIKACSPQLLLLRMQKKTPAVLNRLRNSICGFEGTTPQVCCPENTCTTPEGEAGSCVGLFECPHLLTLIAEMPDQAKRFSCFGPAAYSVCCSANPPSQQPSTTSTSAPPPHQCQASALPPSPSSLCCGVDVSYGQKLFGGAETMVDQYPWLALIEYRKNDKIDFLCHGALISSRYVLTAAHCLTGPVLSAGIPVNVRFGEYIKSSNDDCVVAFDGFLDCADPALDLPIEHYEPHPQYYPGDRSQRNDIGIIRVRGNVPYTDFIRPICLPTTDLTLAPPDGLTLSAAGFGAVNTSISSSNIKLHISLPYSPLDQCQKAYSSPKRNVSLWNKQICAGGVNGQGVCKGDGGAPLVYPKRLQFEVVGIVSFGPDPCGLDGVPDVYTKVYDYIDWITSKIHN